MSESKLLSDEELVIEIRTRDKQLFSELVSRYEDKLMRYATYLIQDEQKALDVVQNAFIKAYVNLHGFDINKKFSSWMYRIVHNEAINSIKKYRKELSIESKIEIMSKEDVEAEFDTKEIIEKAQECLGKMPVIYREPLELFFLEDKSYEEISDILRIPMGTVATRINRAKGIMKTLCQKNN